ncbi:hypothetical protein U8527_02750 [Kordia algicida OT-1]|uniref:Uncharacterized protein n=1 Tax=Kordia algicida OT-1 TaxID=391587 RepID=A9DNN0_9FLAO|nr:hypothetical protein [Kordia algicida]EDP97231.1 hypothetical protein KAOT1_18752 [Kordia algicida OT-1]
MITLKDYIGKIYKEVTNAKVQSDIETLAIAQEYVENPMLRHFAVPNIRIKDMELTIPVAVDATQTVTRDYTAAEIQKVYEDAFYKVNADLFPNRTEEEQRYLEDIRPELVTKAQHESSRTERNLQQASATATPQQETTSKSAGDENTAYMTAVTEAANQFVDASYGFVSEINVEEEVFRYAMVQEIESNLQPRKPAIEDLPVIVETNRLKEINDPASMISIKVNITDDAMEWITDIDENGNTVQTLDYQ